jgi:hypothetical protein
VAVAQELPDLRVTQVLQPQGALVAGGRMSIHLVITNTGAPMLTPQEIVVTNRLPPGVVPVALPPVCRYTVPDVTCRATGSLTEGAELFLRLDVQLPTRVPHPLRLTNQVMVNPQFTIPERQVQNNRQNLSFVVYPVEEALHR